MPPAGPNDPVTEVDQSNANDTVEIVEDPSAKITPKKKTGFARQLYIQKEKRLLPIL